MKTIVLIIIVLAMGTATIKAQHLSSSQGAAAFGIGSGLPYGGIGGKLSFNPLDNFTLFGGFGYNMSGIGANGGLQLSIPSAKQTEFYFSGMYGYNSVIVIKDGMGMGGSYYGPSFGLGLKINSLRSEGNHWDVGILAPVRSQKYKDDLDQLERLPYINIESKPWPVLFYFGYNFNIGSKL